MNVVVDYEHKSVRDEQKFFEVVSYSKTWGANLSVDSVENYRKGYKLTEEQETLIIDTYLKIFGESKER